MKNDSSNILETLQLLSKGSASRQILKNKSQNSIPFVNKKLLKDLCLEIMNFSNAIILNTSTIPFLQDQIVKTNNSSSDITLEQCNTDTNNDLFFNKMNILLKDFLVPELYRNLSLPQYIEKLKYQYSNTNSTNLSLSDFVYQNIKTIAALSNSIYYEVKNYASSILVEKLISKRNNNIRLNILSYTQLLLVKCELTGVKNYIFSFYDDLSISSFINKTNYFILFSSIIKSYCFKQLELTEANILFHNNEYFSLLLPKSLKSQLDQCAANINFSLAKAFNGCIYFSCTDETIKTYEIEDLGCKWNKVLEKHDHKICNQFNDINYGNTFNVFKRSKFEFPNSLNNLIVTYKKKSFELKAIQRQRNIKKQSWNCYTIFRDFNHKVSCPILPGLEEESHKTSSNYFTRDLISNFLFSQALNLPTNFASLELIFESPDHSLNKLNNNLNLLTLINHYEIAGNIIEHFSFNSNIHSDGIINQSEKLQVIYKSFDNLILIGPLKSVINFTDKMLSKLKFYPRNSYKIPAFLNINKLNDNLLLNCQYQYSQYFIHGLRLKNRFRQKMIIFGEEFTFSQFTNVITLSGIITKLISQDSVNENNKEIILKNLSKCSYGINKLVRNSAKGHLSFEELYKYKYLLSNMDMINETDGNLLINTFDEIIKNALINRESISWSGIIPTACKIADFVTIDSQTH